MAPLYRVGGGSTVGLHARRRRHAGPLPPPWRHDDHYGFGRLSCIEERDRPHRPGGD